MFFVVATQSGSGQRSSWLDDLESVHVRAEGFRHDDRAVGPLIVLQDRHHGSSRREPGAGEGWDETEFKKDNQRNLHRDKEPSKPADTAKTDKSGDKPAAKETTPKTSKADT